MDVATLISIAVPVASFLLGHFHLLLPAPSSAAPALPTSFGHGELLQYLLKLIASGSVPVVVPNSSPSSSQDIVSLLSQLLAVLDKQHAPATPVAPAKPQ